MNNSLSELKRLLKKRQPVFQRVNDAIEEGRVGVWGYGFLGKWLLANWGNLANKPPVIFDINALKLSADFNIEILLPNAIPSSCDAVLIGARHNVTEISDKLNNIGMPCISVDEFFVQLLFEEYQRALGEFADDKSKRTLLCILNSIIDGKVVCEELVGNMYFEPQEFFPSFDDIFIDAGAYTGDTLEDFIKINIGTFEKIVCFEPGEAQFQRLKNRKTEILKNWIINEERIVLERKGVGKESRVAWFDASATDSMAHHFSKAKKSDKDGKIDILSLDDYLQGRPATFLKSDVEGADLDFLKGSLETIQRFLPRLAISCYHYPTDLVDMLDLIKNLDCGYKFKLRHHARVLGDYVLYGYR